MDKNLLSAIRVIRAGPAEGLFFETPEGPAIHPGGEVILLENGMIHVSGEDGEDVTTHLSRCDILWKIGRPPTPAKTPEDEANTVTPMKRRR